MAMPPPATRHRRVAASSFLGTTIEYYDFLLYGTAAALVFNKVFFADLSPVIGTVVALATLAAGYVARLGGAVLFGHFGDRLGRKTVMLTTMLLMGITSGLIGLLPTYDQVGELAPLLLVVLRVLQGLAVGGEYGGAVLMTAEHATAVPATARHRGLASSAAAMGAPAGSVLATAAMSVVTLLPEPQLLSWGWRVPFLASFLLLAVGLYFRVRIAESPVFLAQQADPAPTGAPFVVLLRTHPGRLLKSIAFQVGPYCGQGVFGIFVISYAPTIGYPRGVALGVILADGVVELTLRHRSAEAPPAVDRQHLPVDPLGVIGEQERHRGGDIVDPAQTRRRDPLQDHRPVLLGVGPHRVLGEHQSGRDDVASHVLLAPAQGDVLAQRQQPRLRRAVAHPGCLPVEHEP